MKSAGLRAWSIDYPCSEYVPSLTPHARLSTALWSYIYFTLVPSLLLSATTHPKFLWQSGVGSGSLQLCSDTVSSASTVFLLSLQRRMVSYFLQSLCTSSFFIYGSIYDFADTRARSRVAITYSLIRSRTTSREKVLYLITHPTAFTCELKATVPKIAYSNQRVAGSRFSCVERTLNPESRRVPLRLRRRPVVQHPFLCEINN